MTWEMFVDDDLSAFTDQAIGFSQSAHALENDLVYTQVTSNPAMKEDGTTLFHANHNNTDEGSGAARRQDAAQGDARRDAFAAPASKPRPAPTTAAA